MNMEYDRSQHTRVGENVTTLETSNDSKFWMIQETMDGGHYPLIPEPKEHNQNEYTPMITDNSNNNNNTWQKQDHRNDSTGSVESYFDPFSMHLMNNRTHGPNTTGDNFVRLRLNSEAEPRTLNSTATIKDPSGGLSLFSFFHQLQNTYNTASNNNNNNNQYLRYSNSRDKHDNNNNNNDDDDQNPYVSVVSHNEFEKRLEEISQKIKHELFQMELIEMAQNAEKAAEDGKETFVMKSNRSMDHHQIIPFDPPTQQQQHHQSKRSPPSPPNIHQYSPIRSSSSTNEIQTPNKQIETFSRTLDRMRTTGDSSDLRQASMMTPGTPISSGSSSKRTTMDIEKPRQIQRHWTYSGTGIDLNRLHCGGQQQQQHSYHLQPKLLKMTRQWQINPPSPVSPFTTTTTPTTQKKKKPRNTKISIMDLRDVNKVFPKFGVMHNRIGEHLKRNHVLMSVTASSGPSIQSPEDINDRSRPSSPASIISRVSKGLGKDLSPISSFGICSDTNISFMYPNTMADIGHVDCTSRDDIIYDGNNYDYPPVASSSTCAMADWFFDAASEAVTSLCTNHTFLSTKPSDSFDSKNGSLHFNSDDFNHHVPLYESTQNDYNHFECFDSSDYGGGGGVNKNGSEGLFKDNEDNRDDSLERQFAQQSPATKETSSDNPNHTLYVMNAGLRLLFNGSAPTVHRKCRDSLFIKPLHPYDYIPRNTTTNQHTEIGSSGHDTPSNRQALTNNVPYVPSSCRGTIVNKLPFDSFPYTSSLHRNRSRSSLVDEDNMTESSSRRKFSTTYGIGERIADNKITKYIPPPTLIVPTGLEDAIYPIEKKYHLM